MARMRQGCATAKAQAYNAPRARGPVRSANPLKKPVEYGQGWFESTKQLINVPAEEQAQYRRLMNHRANHGLERKDLYTDNWEGDVYVGDFKHDTLKWLGGLSAVMIALSVAVGVTARVEPHVLHRFPTETEEAYGAGPVAPFDA